MAMMFKKGWGVWEGHISLLVHTILLLDLQWHNEIMAGSLYSYCIVVAQIKKRNLDAYSNNYLVLLVPLVPLSKSVLPVLLSNVLISLIPPKTLVFTLF